MCVCGGWGGGGGAGALSLGSVAALVGPPGPVKEWLFQGV